jgi:hypothetical protein
MRGYTHGWSVLRLRGGGGRRRLQTRQCGHTRAVAASGRLDRMHLASSWPPPVRPPARPPARRDQAACPLPRKPLVTARHFPCRKPSASDTAPKRPRSPVSFSLRSAASMASSDKRAAPVARICRPSHQHSLLSAHIHKPLLQLRA